MINQVAETSAYVAASATANTQKRKARNKARKEIPASRKNK